MIVTDLNLGGINSLPAEADPPLVIDPDGVPAGTVPLKSLKSVPGRDSQIGKLTCGIKLDELAKRNSRNPRKAGTGSGLVEPLRLGIFEGGDHGRGEIKSDTGGSTKLGRFETVMVTSISMPQNKSSDFAV